MFPQINKKQMGLQLKKIMRDRGVTPKEIQKFLELSCVQTVYRWMEGVNIPCVDHLYAISILLDVTINEIISGKIWHRRTYCFSKRGECEWFLRNNIEWEKTFLGELKQDFGYICISKEPRNYWRVRIKEYWCAANIFLST